MNLTAGLCTNQNDSKGQRDTDLISRQDFLPGFQIKKNGIIRSAKATVRGGCLGHRRDKKNKKNNILENPAPRSQLQTIFMF